MRERFWMRSTSLLRTAFEFIEFTWRRGSVAQGSWAMVCMGYVGRTSVRSVALEISCCLCFQHVVCRPYSCPLSLKCADPTKLMATATVTPVECTQSFRVVYWALAHR